MARLIEAVHLTDPETKRRVVLQPGEEPAPHLAALITNESAWEDGILPDLPTPETGPEDNDPGEGEKATDPEPEPDPDPEPEPAPEPEDEAAPTEEATAKTTRKTTARKPAAQ